MNKKEVISKVGMMFFIIAAISFLIIIFFSEMIGDGTNLAKFLVILCLFSVLGLIVSLVISKNIDETVRQENEIKQKEIAHSREAIVNEKINYYKNKLKEEMDVLVSEGFDYTKVKSEELSFKDSYGYYCYCYCFTNDNKFCILQKWDSVEQQIDTAVKVYYGNDFYNSIDKSKINNFIIYSISIPLDDIEYFQLTGEKHITTSISGGAVTGGGSSLKGAIVGGAIAGGAGAVIGSRKQTRVSEIKTHTNVFDNRQVELIYKKDDKISHMIFSVYSFDVFKSVIPEKEYAYVIAHNQKNQNETSSTSIKDRLKQLNELKNDGLIKDDEYELKRNELLNQV